MQQMLHLLGYASGAGGVDANCAQGPEYLQRVIQRLEIKNLVWDDIIKYEKRQTPAATIANLCHQLALDVMDLLTQHHRFSVIGGDHTSAIGTWSGVASAYQSSGDIGLIWIDAHMDSHTPQTTITHRIHGMPLAILMGHGLPELTNLLGFSPKLKPENVCLIGVRSYEAGEENFLQEQRVKIFYMDEVKREGFESVIQKAIAHVSQKTTGFGISLDLDSIDPLEAPGVDVPEADGIHCEMLYQGLLSAAKLTNFICAEIVEFNPTKDKEQKTEKIILRLLKILSGRVDA